MKVANASVVAALREYLHFLNVDAEQLLGPALPDNSAIPIQQWQKMLQVCADHVRQPAFGLQFAGQMDAGKLGLVGYLAASCHTLGEAFERGLPYGQLVSELNPTQFHVDGERIILSWPPVYGLSGLVCDEFGLGTIATVMRSLLGEAFSPLGVDFADPEPPDRHIYDEYFGCEVRFGQPAPAIAFSSHCLSLKLAGADAGLKHLLDEFAADKLGKAAKLGAELADYQRQLEHLIDDGSATLEAFAAHNCISVRLLQRKLKNLGTSFLELLDVTRRHMAERYLADDSLELSKIAHRLGYTEQSSFTRAFKMWTGKTPHQWRSASLRKQT
jgi:AraC-like DNA-binding protein